MSRWSVTLVVNVVLLVIWTVYEGTNAETYFIPPSYPVPSIPRGYQPPPSGPLVDEYAYSAGIAPPPSPPQYTIIRFNSREPYPPPQQQQQVEHRLDGNLFALSQSHTMPLVQSHTLSPVQSHVLMPVQSSINEKLTGNFNSIGQRVAPSQIATETDRPHDPMVINTLIQVFSGEAQEKEISLAEARSMSAIEGGSTTVDAIASNPNRVILLRKLDTQTRSFLPSVDSQTSDDTRYVLAKAYAASNSSAISKVELEAELSRELEVSIPLIIDELEKLQHHSIIFSSTTSALPVWQSSTARTPPRAIPTLSTELFGTDEDLHSADLERLIDEGLAEVDQPQTTTPMPLLIFTKTSTMSKATASIFTPSTTALVDEQEKAKLFSSVSTTIYPATKQSDSAEPTAEENLTIRLESVSTQMPTTFIVDSKKSDAMAPESEGDDITTIIVTESTEKSTKTQMSEIPETKGFSTQQQKPAIATAMTADFSIDKTSDSVEMLNDKDEATTQISAITESSGGNKSTNMVEDKLTTITVMNTETTVHASRKTLHQLESHVVEELLPHVTENQMEVITDESTEAETTVPSTVEITVMKTELISTKLESTTASTEYTEGTKNEFFEDFETSKDYVTTTEFVNSESTMISDTTTVDSASTNLITEFRSTLAKESTIGHVSETTDTFKTTEPNDEEVAVTELSVSTINDEVTAKSMTSLSDQTEGVTSSSTKTGTIVTIDTSQTTVENKPTIVEFNLDKSNPSKDDNVATIDTKEMSSSKAGEEITTEEHTTITATMSEIESSRVTNSDMQITTTISEMPEIIGTTIINTESCTTPQTDGAVRGDVLFLLDGSSATNISQFRQSVELIWDTVKEFGADFGPNAIQVSLVQNSKDPALEFSFRGHKCLDDVLDDISDTERVGGESNINRAIDKVTKFAFTKSRGDRPDVENVIVLVTGGAADQQKIHFPLEWMSNDNTTMVVIANVESSIEDFAMLMLRNGDTEQNRFNVTELDSLMPMARRLANRIRKILAGNHELTVVTNSGTILWPAGESTGSTISELDDRSKLAVTGSTAVDFTQNDDNSDTSTSFDSLVSMSDANEVSDNDRDATMTTVVTFSVNTDGIGTSSTRLPLIETARPPVSLDDVSVIVDCLAGGIRANFTLPADFHGSIVAKDFESDEKCVSALNASDTKQTKNVEIFYPNCGMHFMKSERPRGINESIVLSVVHDRRLETGLDRSFVIQCFIPLSVTTVAGRPADAIPEAEELETNLSVVPGMALSRTISVVGAPPKCVYSLRRDSPNGAVAQMARIGETLYHRWECANVVDGNDVSSAFGLHIYDCHAKSQLNNSAVFDAALYQFIDENGCTTDSALVNDITYAPDRLVAYAHANVFTLQDVEALRFSCKAALCVRDGDGCEGYSPPICRNSTSAHALAASRLLRQMDSSIEAALSTDLNAPQLMILSSTAEANSHDNNTHRKNGGVSIGSPRLFASPILSKSSVGVRRGSFSLIFAAIILVSSIIFGIALGVVCFGFVRCLQWCRRGNDDRINLVETTRGSINRHDTGYYVSHEDEDNECFSDALSFNGAANAVSAMNPAATDDDGYGLPTVYCNTLERRVEQSSSFASESNATAAVSANGNAVSNASGHYACNIATASSATLAMSTVIK